MGRETGCSPYNFAARLARRRGRMILRRTSPRSAAGRCIRSGISLGGCVVLNMLARHHPEGIGRVVPLGSPCCGSHAGERILRVPLLRGALGRDAAQWLARPLPRCRPATDRRGRRQPPGRHGAHRARHGEANDGMVTVAETRWPGARPPVLPVTHMQMLWSRACLIQTLHFLDTGRFLRGGVRADRAPLVGAGAQIASRIRRELMAISQASAAVAVTVARVCAGPSDCRPAAPGSIQPGPAGLPAGSQSAARGCRCGGRGPRWRLTSSTICAVPPAPSPRARPTGTAARRVRHRRRGAGRAAGGCSA